MGRIVGQQCGVCEAVVRFAEEARPCPECRRIVHHRCVASSSDAHRCRMCGSAVRPDRRRLLWNVHLTDQGTVRTMGIVLLVIATTLSLITGTIHPGSLGARLGILGLAMTLFPWVESFRARYGRRRRRPSNTPLGAQAIAGRFERALYVSYDLPLFPIRGSGTLRTDRSGMHLVGRPVTTPVRAWIHVGGLLLTGFATALALLLTPAAWWAVGGILLVWLALVRWAPHPPRIIEHFVPWDHVELAREDGGGRVEIRVRPPTQFLGDELTAGAIFFRSDARSRLLETIAAQLGL